MKKIVVATRNSGKFIEIKEILTMEDLPLMSLEDYEVEYGRSFGNPSEDGNTFKENAYKKARYFFDELRKFEGDEFLVLAEDSGIVVDVLKGELGVKTRRWGAGGQASDKEWIDYFLNVMRDVPMEKRSARFVCVACLIGNGFVKYFRGETVGNITMELQASIREGVPLSSCFKPKGCGKVYSALAVDEKNKISHRGKAMMRVKSFLKNFKVVP